MELAQNSKRDVEGLWELRNSVIGLTNSYLHFMDFQKSISEAPTKERTCEDGDYENMQYK